MKNITFACIAGFLVALLGLGYLSLNPKLSAGIETPYTRALKADQQAEEEAKLRAEQDAALKVKRIEEQERRERARARAEAAQEKSRLAAAHKAEEEAQAALIAKQNAEAQAAEAMAKQEAVDALAKLNAEKLAQEEELAKQKALAQEAAAQEVAAQEVAAQKMAVAKALAEKKAQAAKKVEIQIAHIVALDSIRFKTASDIITKDSTNTLDKVVVALKKLTTASVEVQGHTDSTGDATRNQALSEKRAKAVKMYLVMHGIKAERLTAVGYGSAKPLINKTTPEANRKNRRVEFKLK